MDEFPDHLVGPRSQDSAPGDAAAIAKPSKSLVDASPARRTQKAALEDHIRDNRRAVLIVNARSRQGARSFWEARSQLLEAGFVLDAAYSIGDAEQLTEIVKKSIAKGHKLIIVGGGDGTLSSVVDHFAYANVVLGILPVGTANSFARELGIPTNVSGALEVIINGRVADVDLAKIDDDYFVNTATLGLAPAIASSTPDGLKKLFGRAAYALVGALKFMSFRPFQVRVREDECTRDFSALQVLIANGRYFGGMLVAHDADPESRSVRVQIVKGPGRWNLVRAWLAVLNGRRPNPTLVTDLIVENAIIEADPRQYVSIDGEVAAQTPLRLQVAREALILMVPATFDDTDEGRSDPYDANATSAPVSMCNVRQVDV